MTRGQPAPAPRRPHLTGDIESSSFWQGLREHRILVPSCAVCGTRRFPARPVCARHPGDDTVWVPCPPQGSLVSWVVTHRAVHPAFAELVPYAVLLVRLAVEPDLLVYGNFVGDLGELRADLPLEPVFDDVEPGLTLLQWRARR